MGMSHRRKLAEALRPPQARPEPVGAGRLSRRPACSPSVYPPLPSP